MSFSHMKYENDLLHRCNSEMGSCAVCASHTVASRWEQADRAAPCSALLSHAGGRLIPLRSSWCRISLKLCLSQNLVVVFGAVYNPRLLYYKVY